MANLDNPTPDQADQDTVVAADAGLREKKRAYMREYMRNKRARLKALRNPTHETNG